MDKIQEIFETNLIQLRKRIKAGLHYWGTPKDESTVTVGQYVEKIAYDCIEIGYQAGIDKRNKMTDPCIWTIDSDYAYYSTGCGKNISFDDDVSDYVGCEYKYCPFCGQKIVVEEQTE